MDGKQKLVEEIRVLKEKHNAVILAHNYQLPEVQEIADFSGDSLELSRKAKDIPKDVIVFCGVHFMAETAALLSPNKTVLLPDEGAGCPMADMADAESVLKMRREHPDAIAVVYVNSTAAVKALCDVTCTSANAAEIVSRIPEGKEIIFIPDKYLGKQVERMTGRKLILWPGYCPTHVRMLPEHIEKARADYPGAAVIVHPESRPEVCLAADAVLSTGGMCRFSSTTDKETIVVGTETGLIYRLQKENPDKKFVPLLERAVCPNMKLTTLESIRLALTEMKYKIEVSPEMRPAARASIERMLVDGPIESSEVILD